MGNVSLGFQSKFNLALIMLKVQSTTHLAQERQMLTVFCLSIQISPVVWFFNTEDMTLQRSVVYGAMFRVPVLLYNK